ncbi:MAG: T9SS type A sorting domain-containing protein [Prolixibacteraceae bacterium]
MKKLYFITLAIFSLLLMSSLKNYAQEMIVGGNMENEDDWMVSLLNQDADNEAAYEFDYTKDKPQFGEGGCLYVSGTNTGTTGGNLTNIMFYQEITLTRGIEYQFTGAYKDIRSNSYWCEVYVGGNEPAEGSDYGGDQGAVFVSGFKSTNWEAACPADAFDGTFQDDACTGGTTNMVFYEGEGDTTVYFGFRMGIWDGDANGWTFDTYIDNISLMGPDATSVKLLNSADIKVFPSKVSENLTVQLATTIRKIEIVNLVGQSIKTFNSIDSNSALLNLSSVKQGIYQVIVTDKNGSRGTTKIVKL